MNTTTQRVLIAVLLLLFMGSAGQYWQTQQALEISRLEIAQLQTKVDQLDSQVEQLQGQVALLGKTSVQGVVREANSALIDGWSSLMSTVERELVKARESMGSAQDSQQGSVTQMPGLTNQAPIDAAPSKAP